ncbi:50S ribosomal protein L13, partial [candidate division KSB1 bacterium]
KVASILRGKHKPVFSPHIDVGDYVIIINADKIRVTGDKENQKMYYRHTGYIGHLKSISLKDMREKNPEFIIYNSIKKMLPKNSLGRSTIKKLKVYAGPDHPHSSQKPEVLEINN